MCADRPRKLCVADRDRVRGPVHLRLEVLVQAGVVRPRRLRCGPGRDDLRSLGRRQQFHVGHPQCRRVVPRHRAEDREVVADHPADGRDVEQIRRVREATDDSAGIVHEVDHQVAYGETVPSTRPAREMRAP